MNFIGWPELVLILVILMLIFGGSRIKNLAKGLGESVREFKKATNEPVNENDDSIKSIIDAAKKMGINTDGKDIKQILKEMEKKTAKD